MQETKRIKRPLWITLESAEDLGQELELRGGQPGANFNVSLDLLSQDQDWMKHDETAEIDRNSWNVGENWHDFNLLWLCLGYCPQMFFPPPFPCRAPMREVILRRSSSSWQLLITNAGTGRVPIARNPNWFHLVPKDAKDIMISSYKMNSN